MAITIAQAMAQLEKKMVAYDGRVIDRSIISREEFIALVDFYRATTQHNLTLTTPVNVNLVRSQ